MTEQAPVVRGPGKVPVTLQVNGMEQMVFVEPRRTGQAIRRDEHLPVEPRAGARIRPELRRLFVEKRR